MDGTMIAYQMGILFLLIGFGYLLGKMKVISGEFNSNLSSLVVKITSPALVLSSVMTSEVQGSALEVFQVFLISLVMYLLLPLVAVLLVRILRIPKQQYSLYQFMTIFSNIGFMGFPVVQAIFGSGAVFYTAIFNLTYNIFVYTAGVSIMTKNSNTEKNKASKKSISLEECKVLLKKIWNPGIAAALAAAVIFFLNIKVPYVIANSCTLVGNITTPLAMMITGVSLSDIPLKEVFGEFRLYPYTIIKQCLFPVIIWFLLKSVITNEYILGVTVIISAMPVGMMSVMFSSEYGQDVKLATKGVFITTLASFITIPLITIFFA